MVVFFLVLSNFMGTYVKYLKLDLTKAIVEPKYLMKQERDKGVEGL